MLPVTIPLPVAITHTLLTAGINAGNLKVYTTPSIAPAANALITVAVLVRRSGAAQTPKLSGGGMAVWTLVTSVDFNLMATPTSRLMVFRAMGLSPGSGALTISFANSQSNVQWSVSQWTGVDQTGTNGSGAIGQTGSARGDMVSALSVALAAFGNPNNIAYGVVGAAINGPAVTPGTGFTEITQTSSGEGTLLEAEQALNLNNVQASLSKAARAGASGIEIKADVSAVPVASVTVSPPSASVAVGDAVPLSAMLMDAAGNPLSGRIVTWRSDNPGVASVSQSGNVTGVAEGSATITATSENQVGTSTVTVTARVPVVSVIVSPPSPSVAVGDVVLLTATLLDAAGKMLSGRIITWQSDNPGVASVSQGGMVTGVAEGSATITATSENQSGMSAVTVTAPIPGSTVVLAGAGDIASCLSSGDEATATLLDNIPGTVFTAGDNAYEKGSAAEYSQCYEPSWGRHKARTHPAPGNHDYGTAGAADYFSYYGALAGVSGTGYYSYDIGAWHIISLNSNIAMSVGSPQELWLRADLGASPKQCTIAYWHHPRFSSGTKHGSTLATQPLWQALYDSGADIVISGHEHNYERFAPQTPTGAADPATGIREFVAGTGGESHYTGLGTPLPNSELFNGTTWGVLKLTLGSGTYSWQFIPIAGETFTDAGTSVCHGAPGGGGGGVSATTSTVTASPTPFTAGSGSSTITVTAKEASGNPINGASVVFASTGFGNTFTPSTATTGSDGVATSTFTSTVAESKSLSATATGVAITQQAAVTVTPDVPVALVFTTQPTNTGANAPITPAVVVEIRDQYGNRVTSPASVTMVLSPNPAAGSLTGTSPQPAPAGVATFPDLKINNVGSGYRLVAGSFGLPDAPSNPFDITPPVPSPGNSSVIAGTPSFIAGGSSLITITVKDGNNLPMKDVGVTLSSTVGGDGITQPANLADVNGVTTGTVSATSAGSRTIIATATLVTLSQKPVLTVNAGTQDAGASTVSANPATIVAGNGSSTITVTVRDQYGNAVNLSDVVLGATGTGNTFGQPALTGPNGVTTGSVSSTDRQTEKVTATAGGVLISQQPSIIVLDQPPPAMITHGLLTSGSDVTNAKMYTTASIAPAANALVTIAVIGHQSTAASASPTVTGGGMPAWVEVATVTLDNIATPKKRMSIFRAMSSTPGSGPITITFPTTESNGTWIVSQWTGVITTGTNGSGAVRLPPVINRADAVTSIGATLPALESPYNVAYGVVGTNGSAIGVNPGAGFTEISEQKPAESTNALLEALFAANQTAPSASWTGTFAAAILAIEIKAAP